MARQTRPALPLLGREEELAAIERALDERRLITLWGPPGVGKTRLASEVVQRGTEDSEAAPCFFWDLSLVQSTAALCALVAQRLELEVGRAPSDVEQLGKLLAEHGPQLIVLDNFEQAGEGASDVLGRWLELAPETSWLVASRERLGLAGEQVIEIRPLPKDSAMQLFADRARQANPSFSLTPESSGQIQKLVERLDHLPLAIELCACRAGVLSPQQLLGELMHGLGSELLSAPPRGGLRGLDDAIGSSWAALTPWQQATLEQCSAFVGAFTAQAAAAVVDLSAFPDAPSLFDVIQALVDRSLLTSVESSGGQSRRFQMLVCIAEFARVRLAESGNRDQVYARHATYFSKLGRAWSERTLALQDLEARGEIELARDELMAIHQRALAREAGLNPNLAVKAALALLPWYRRFGPYTALLEVLDRALAAVPDLDPALSCKALGARGSTLRLLGRLDEAQVELERAIALASELDAPVLGALIESELAQTLLEKDDHAAARKVQERVLQVYRRHHQRVLEGHALAALGHMHYYVDDLEASQRSYEQALAVHREVGDRVYECEALRSLALVELELGRRGSARAHFEQALAAIDSVNERRWRTHTLGYFGILEQEVGNHRRATSLYSQAIAEARLVGRWRAEAVFRGYLGTCLLEQGALDEARTELMRAIDDLGVFERMASRALFRACIAVVDTMRGDIDAATREIELARAELDRSPEQVFLRRAVEIHAGHVELARARAAAHASEHTESEALFTDARTLLEQPGFAQSDVRFAQRMLERAIKGWVAPRRARPWRVHETGLWFEPPYGTRVELGRKHALRRLLVSLAERHAAAERGPLSAADLIAAGWPGERIQKHAAANRLRVALHTLRRMGLSDLLVTHADGYHFDPRAPLELVEV